MVDDYSELASCPLSKLLVFLSEVLQHDNIVDCCSQILWGLPENRAEATVGPQCVHGRQSVQTESGFDHA